MIHAQFPQALLLKRLLDSLRDLVDVSTLAFTPECLRFYATDSSHSLSFLCEFDQSTFQAYSAPVPASTCVSLCALSKVLRLSDAEDSLTLTLDQRRDVMTLELLAKGGRKRTEFALNLCGNGLEEVAARGKPAAEVELRACHFARLCKDLHSIADTLEIDVSQNDVLLSVNSEVSAGRVSLRSTAKGKFREEVQRSLSLDFLAQISRAALLSDTVLISLPRRGAVRLTFPWQDGRLCFYLGSSD